MTENARDAAECTARRWETALIFVLFFLQGAWPVPHVNEPYYIGEAIHFWNPSWVQGDFFLQTANSHVVFCFLTGWLGLFLSPGMMTWFLRLLAWGLLAWSWRRMSFAVVPHRGWAVLSAALFVTLNSRADLANEWVVGGVEAKVFAYVLVFLAIEAMVRNRWRRTWLLLGAAAAVHVLVGGWMAVAAALAWCALRISRRPGLGRALADGLCTADARRLLVDSRAAASPQSERAARPPSLVAMLPALAAGFLLALPGLIPALLLQRGLAPELIDQANLLYVYVRLPHHLDPSQMRPEYWVRFLCLIVINLVLARLMRGDGRQGVVQAVVAGTLAIALVGGVFTLGKFFAPELAAKLLRYYWFRAADVAVPLGVSLAGVGWIARQLRTTPWVALRWLAVAAAAAVLYFAPLALDRVQPQRPPADAVPNAPAWRGACEWIATSGVIPPDARFITPRSAITFKWYARRPQVVSWKEIPQEAEAIVEWRQRLQDLYATGWPESDAPMYEWPNLIGVDRLRAGARKYDADYIITLSFPPLPLPLVFANDGYAIYRIDGAEQSAR